MNTPFGETLRNAREAKGLTTSQVAAQTRMLVQIVEDMEREDFHRIAAPIYGRGFVKLYAECVGLDPLPLVREFMDIYEGRRAPIVRTREVPSAVAPPPPPPAPEPEEPVEEPIPESRVEPAEEPVDEPAEEPAEAPAGEPEEEPVEEPVEEEFEEQPAEEEAPTPEPPPVVRGLDLFERPPEPAAAPRFAAPAGDGPAVARNADRADIFSDSPYLTSTYAESGPSAAERFRKSLSSVSHGVVGTVQRIPRSAWRISLLAAAGAVVAVLAAWGCVKLYRMTSAAPAQPPAAPVAPVAVQPEPRMTYAAPAESTPAAKPVLRSTGPRVPPLYVD